MRLSSPLTIVLTLLATWIVHPNVRAGDAEENLSRIKAMSRADRARMSKALETFDALDGSKRDAVRELNERLAGLDPASRTRYLALMRRYHVFYQNLPKEKREALDRETDSAKKLNLIANYRAEQKNQPVPAKVLSDGLQISTLTTPHGGQNPLRLRGVARHLIVYFSLDPVSDAQVRVEFARSKSPAERETLIGKLMQAKARDDRQSLREKLREEEEEFRAAEDTVLKNPTLAKRLLQAQTEGLKANPQSKKAVIARSKGNDATADDPTAKFRKQLVLLLDEQQVLRDLDAEIVLSANLDRFEAALPPWARGSLDDLPPDAARRRLKALYRLVYPSPEEIPIPKNTTPAKARRPAPTVPGSVSPF